MMDVNSFLLLCSACGSGEALCTGVRCKLRVCCDFAVGPLNLCTGSHPFSACF